MKATDTEHPLVLRSITVGSFAENTYLLGDRDVEFGVLVDPGDEAMQLLEMATAEGLRIGEIWLTHAHLDHVGAVAEVVQQTSASIFLHPDDGFLYETVAEQAQAFGVEIVQPPPVDRWLRTGDALSVGRFAFDVLHVPGHSPGHVAFHCVSEGLIVSGDCLFAGSIGRTDLPGGSLAVLLESIDQRFMTLSDATHVLPGHGPATTIGAERVDNPFLAAAFRESLVPGSL